MAMSNGTDDGPGESAFVAEASPWRMGAVAALLFGLLVLALVGAGVLGDIPNPEPWFLLGVPLLGPFALAALGQLGQTGPVVRIDAEGIWCRQWHMPKVLWAEIAYIAVRRLPYEPYQQTLAVEFHAPDRHQPRDRLHRWLNRYRLPGHGDISVLIPTADRRFADLVAAVEQFAPDKLSELPSGSRLEL